jgi:hypothetical protein
MLERLLEYRVASNRMDVPGMCTEDDSMFGRDTMGECVQGCFASILSLVSEILV